MPDGTLAARERSPSATLGLLLLLLGGFNLTLALLLNERTLSFLYADGRLVRDVLSRIHTVQVAFAALGLSFTITGTGLRARSRRAVSGRVVDVALAALLLAYLPVMAELLLSLRHPGFYKVWDPFGLCHTSLAVSDRRLGHVLNPHLDRSYRINRRGFRGGDFPERKPPGETRIVAVGDSITFGWELSDDEATYPGKLQALLESGRTRSRTFRVINAGVPRYTSAQALALIRERVLGLEPDLVVLCVGWNDLAFSYRPDWRPLIELTVRPRDRYCRRFSPAILRTVRSWKQRLEDAEEESESGKPPGRRIPHPGAAAEFRARLEEIVSLLEERDVGLLLLNLPSVLSREGMSEAERRLSRQFPEVENLALFEGIVRGVCHERRVPCAIDVFPLEQAGKGRYFYDHCHPNEEGHAIVAQKVFDAIARDPRLARLLRPSDDAVASGFGDVVRDPPYHPTF